MKFYKNNFYNGNVCITKYVSFFLYRSNARVLSRRQYYIKHKTEFSIAEKCGFNVDKKHGRLSDYISKGCYNRVNILRFLRYKDERNEAFKKKYYDA